MDNNLEFYDLTKVNKINNGCSIDEINLSLKLDYIFEHKMKQNKGKSIPDFFRHRRRRSEEVSNRVYHRNNISNMKKKIQTNSALHPANLLIYSASFCLLIEILLLILFLPSTISTSGESYQATSNQQLHNKYSSQFSISQLCAGKSQFPITKRVEGALLSSSADLDVNCTITFRTKSAQQHFIIRFEELKLGCDDHLKMFDGDLDYGQPSIKDFSCRDSLASVPILKTTGTYLTIRFSTDSKSKQDDGFRLVMTAVFDTNKLECPHDYTVCHNFLCISRSLICDDVNHCLDNSDEIDCSSRSAGGSFGSGGSSSGNGLLATNPSGNLFVTNGDTSLSYAFVLLIVLAVISICVTICVSALCCRRESHYAQYQHHLQRAIGVPLQTSSSLMFANHPQQYHYFQPANISPFITPQHQFQQQLQQHQHQQHQLAAAGATLPRGYSTLPLNMPAAIRYQTTLQHNQQQPKGLAKAIPNEEFLMMAGMGINSSNNNAHNNLAGPTGRTMQTNLFLPTSQSILATTAIANNVAGHQIRFPPPHQPPGR